jgi:hypothetical protein
MLDLFLVFIQITSTIYVSLGFEIKIKCAYLRAANNGGNVNLG